MFKMRAKMISVGLLGTAAMLPLDFAKADQLGHASWYSLPANTTANGERMNPDELTAAHRSLPFGTRVLVENLTNGRSVVVRINDRGPFIGGRIIDLSKAAAESIGMIGAGTAQVRVSTTAPDGGNALAALGEATAKARNGVALAAKESTSAEPHRTASKAASARFIEAKNHSARTPKLSTVASMAQVKAKTRLASASIKTRHVAMSHGSHAKVAVAWEPPRSKKAAKYAAKSHSSKTRVAVSYSYKTGPAATGGGPRQRLAKAPAHPYAIFASAPGFMKPAAS